jgi:hypothetical protein
MHVVVIVALLAALVFLLKLALTPSAPRVEPEAQESKPWDGSGAVDAGVDVAFLSNGNLFYKNASGRIEQLHSPYIQEMADRVEKSRERNAWKEGTSFNISASGGMRRLAPDENRIMATGAQFVGGHLYYSLKDAGMGGLFCYVFAGKTERRLLHRQNLDLSDLHFDPGSDRILGASRQEGDMSHIVMMDREGDQLRSLTGGDTCDAAPVWSSIEGREILYQSTGLARNEQGIVLARSHTTIQQLSMGSGTITPILDDARFDFLQPRVSDVGDLYFIRRPYEAPKYAASSFLADTLLFPFRLLRAVFHYLNFFSLMYTRKPLTSASGPAMQADVKDIILKGKRIDAEKALREGAVEGVPSLVPRNWELRRRTRDGQEELVATHVLSYCLLDGGILYSNGRAVFLQKEGGKPQLVLKSDLVDEVVAGNAGERITD